MSQGDFHTKTSSGYCAELAGGQSRGSARGFTAQSSACIAAAVWYWQGGGSERLGVGLQVCAHSVWMSGVYSLCLAYHDAFVRLRLFPLLLLFVFHEATNGSNMEVDIRSAGLWIWEQSPLQGFELSGTITAQRWKHCAYTQRRTGFYLQLWSVQYVDSLIHFLNHINMLWYTLISTIFLSEICDQMHLFFKVIWSFNSWAINHSDIPVDMFPTWEYSQAEAASWMQKSALLEG